MTNTYYTLIVCLTILYFTPAATLRLYEILSLAGLHVRYLPVKLKVFYQMWQVRREIEGLRTTIRGKYSPGISLPTTTSAMMSEQQSPTSLEQERKKNQIS